MKLIDVKPRGTYFGLHPTPETKAAMREFLHDYEIPNPLDMEKMHCTVIFSRAFCGEQALGDLDPHWQGNFDKYDLFDSAPKENQDQTKCLVLKFVCPELIDHLKSKGATHDFPELTPHMTLSYNVGLDYDHSDLPEYDGPIHFHHEYSEPLNLNWVNTTK